MFCGGRNFLSISFLNVIFFVGELLGKKFPHTPSRTFKAIFLN